MYTGVIDFWFNELTPVQWWQSDAAFDEQVRERFGELHKQATMGELFQWRTTAHGRLAEIIILDQFSRNMYRGTPQAFASDSQALVLAQEAIAAKAPQQLSPVENSFLYMPFMHSESLAIHEVAVELFKHNQIESNIDFELQHQKIIAQFGRYPHRNEILGRESTPEEIEFLKGPNSSF